MLGLHSPFGHGASSSPALPCCRTHPSHRPRRSLQTVQGPEMEPERPEMRVFQDDKPRTTEPGSVAGQSPVLLAMVCLFLWEQLGPGSVLVAQSHKPCCRSAGAENYLVSCSVQPQGDPAPSQGGTKTRLEQFTSSVVTEPGYGPACPSPHPTVMEALLPCAGSAPKQNRMSGVMLDQALQELGVSTSSEHWTWRS